MVRSKVLFAPALVLVFFSIGKVYLVINRLPVPLVDSERVPSRFLILPVVVLVTLGCIQLQRFFCRAQSGKLARAGLFT